MGRSLAIRFACALLLVACATGRARAAESGTPFLSDRFGISAGAYFANARTDFQAGGAHALGVMVSLERDLDLTEATDDARFDGFYRINPRHAIDAGVVTIGRDGHRVTDRKIVFKDRVFETNTDVHTKFDSRLFKLAYRYSFINDGRVETGIITGVSTYSYELSLEGQASLADTSGGGSSTELRSATENIIAPIPTIGIFTTCALRKNLIFRGTAEFFSVNVSSIEGRLIDGKILVDYFPTRRVGIGVGFAGTGMGLKYGTDTQKISVDYRYSGVLAMLDVML